MENHRPVTRAELRKELTAALRGYATKDDLKRFATKKDLEAFTTKKELQSAVTRLSLAIVNLQGTSPI